MGSESWLWFKEDHVLGIRCVLLGSERFICVLCFVCMSVLVRFTLKGKTLSRVLSTTRILIEL